MSVTLLLRDFHKGSIVVDIRKVKVTGTVPYLPWRQETRMEVLTREGATDPADGEDASGVEALMPTVRPRRLGWAKLLRRVLNVDALTCPECTTSMTVIAFLTDPPVLKRILDHLSLPSSPPTVAPARSPLDEAGLFDDEPPDDNGDDWTYQEEGSQIARAPP